MRKTKYTIVLIKFPFADRRSGKYRPALCLTNPNKKYKNIILSPITSQINKKNQKTEVLLETSEKLSQQTGLKTTSSIKIHQLATLSHKYIKRHFGTLPKQYIPQVKKALQDIFEL